MKTRSQIEQLAMHVAGIVEEIHGLLNIYVTDKPDLRLLEAKVVCMLRVFGLEEEAIPSWRVGEYMDRTGQSPPSEFMDEIGKAIAARGGKID